MVAVVMPTDRSCFLLSFQTLSVVVSLGRRSQVGNSLVPALMCRNICFQRRARRSLVTGKGINYCLCSRDQVLSPLAESPLEHSNLSCGILGNASSAAPTVAEWIPAVPPHMGRCHFPCNYVKPRISQIINSNGGRMCGAITQGHPGIVYTSECRVCFPIAMFFSKP